MTILSHCNQPQPSFSAYSFSLSTPHSMTVQPQFNKETALSQHNQPQPYYSSSLDQFTQHDNSPTLQPVTALLLLFLLIEHSTQHDSSSTLQHKNSATPQHSHTAPLNLTPLAPPHAATQRDVFSSPFPHFATHVILCNPRHIKFPLCIAPRSLQRETQKKGKNNELDEADS